MICKRCVLGENEPRQVDIDVGAVSGSIPHRVNYCLIELNRVNYLPFEVELIPFKLSPIPFELSLNRIELRRIRRFDTTNTRSAPRKAQ
jgi:hypothetical protein